MQNSSVFEELPARARRKRKARTDAPVGEDVVPRLLPGSSTVGIGIQALNPSALTGSQRIGIIGLPGTESVGPAGGWLGPLPLKIDVLQVPAGTAGLQLPRHQRLQWFRGRQSLLLTLHSEAIHPHESDAQGPETVHQSPAVGHPTQYSVERCFIDTGRLF